MLMIPENRFISGKYTWISLQNDCAIIGLNQEILNGGVEIYSIDLPIVGEEIEREDYFITVETTSGMIEVYAPVTGHVLEVIEDDLDIALLNIDPYAVGLVVVELDDDFESEQGTSVLSNAYNAVSEIKTREPNQHM